MIDLSFTLKSPRRVPLRTARTLIAAAAGLVAAAAFAAPQAQGNLGQGLRALADFQRGKSELAGAAVRDTLARGFPLASQLRLDEAGRVRVDLQLSGAVPLADVRRAAERLGLVAVAESLTYRHGAIGAFVPIARIEQIARLPGVRAMTLALPPVTFAGKVTSQGVATIRADAAQALGVDGRGITVGAISDSYGAAFRPKTKPIDDVASGDLPGRTNPDGHTEPVVVIREGSGGDEGRAMLQIVHDVAPGARLCFDTALDSPLAFATSIRALADRTGRCGADVIVDDVMYLDEPMFSDGIIAQAVDEVVGQGIAYFSSAGNNPASSGFASAWRPISDADARALGSSVDLSLIPASDTAGGFHDLGGRAGPVDLARTIALPGDGTRIVMQWNDPFDSADVSTDYDLYLFDAAGQQLVAQATDDNRATGRPMEFLFVPKAGTYQLVIARSGNGPAVAKQLRYVVFDGGIANGEHFDFDTPTIYGHTAAAGAISTAAVPWFAPGTLEPFTSTGPVSIQYDAAGQRLAQPQMRIKPDIAAADGGNNTFFGQDTDEDADSQPNFFGTSASAPHAAAVAALMLQKGGGPGSLAPSKVGELLARSAVRHDLRPSFAGARAKAGEAEAAIALVGDGSNPSGTNPLAFQVQLDAPQGYTLRRFTIDVSSANADRVRLGVPVPGLQFDPRGDVGFPFVVGPLKNLAYADISSAPLSPVAPFSQQLTVGFAVGAFTPASEMKFGVDRDEVATSAGGGAADLMAGARFTGVVVDPTGRALPFESTFSTGKVAKGRTLIDGWGLIDAEKAIGLVP